MNTFNVSADLLVQILTKLALSEQAENRVSEQVAMVEAITGEKLPPCHCPACLMPNLAVELNDEIAGQLSDGEIIDDLCTPALIKRIEAGLLWYVKEREAAHAEEVLGKMPKDATVN